MRPNPAARYVGTHPAGSHIKAGLHPMLHQLQQWLHVARRDAKGFRVLGSRSQRA